MSPSRPDLEALLDNATWARALARSLVRDPHHAEDLVQRTFVAAIEHPPRDSSSPRGWLASVLRNLARSDARAAGRREHHERAGARDESVEPDSLERTAALQRELLDAVLSLAEPYKSTIWARYYDGLAPREIAHRDGVPVKTVKTRLVRGLAELRLRLDTKHDGNRSTWLAAFAPLAAVPKGSSILVGVIMMDVKLKIAAAAVVAVGAVAVLSRMTASSHVEPDPLSQAPIATPELERAIEPDMKLALQPALSAREASVEAAKPAPVVTPAAAVTEWSGRVLDLEMNPMRGFEVFARDNAQDIGANKPAMTTTADDGSFHIPTRQGHIEFGARAPGWVTVYAASNAWAQEEDGYPIFVGQERALAGRIVDPQHRPIEGVSVTYIIDKSLRRDIGKPLEHAMASEWRAISDAEGRFSLENAPLTKGQLSVETIGHKPRSVEAPSAPTWNVEIVLDPLEEEHLIVRGTVVDEHAQPISGASVALGAQYLKTGADGTFAFDLNDVREGGEFESDEKNGWKARFPPAALFALKPGKLPTRIELPNFADMRSHAMPNTFTITLSGQPLEIRGRVLNAEGTPVEGAIVRIEDETEFGMVYDEVQGEGIGWAMTAEALLRGQTAFTNTYTDKDGAFKLGGLLDREYHLIACDKPTLQRTQSQVIHAGTSDAEIRLPACHDCTRVAGRVLALDGTPIESAKVVLCSERGGERSPTYGPTMETDKEGRFDFASVATEGMRISVAHPDTFVVLSWKPEPKAALDKLEIRVARKAHLQVDLGEDKTRADHFGLVDAQGKPVEMMVSRGNMMWMPERVDIVDGKSEAVACAENGTTVVLYKDDKEISRLPVHLVPGEITNVRP